MVKVGLVTVASLSRPATRPWVNKVFPLPSSPLRANTEPAFTSLASCRPMASVSAGLLEMNVATGQFALCDWQARSSLRIRYARFAIERANSGQQQLWEFSSPFALQTVSVTWRNRKEQFVVLAF